MVPSRALLVLSVIFGFECCPPAVCGSLKLCMLFSYSPY
uniref:Uncharacterized protein n=1 Tax=Arundo donax TaxID=35708 RepID=A0A0A9AQB0_ARUDO